MKLFSNRATAALRGLLVLIAFVCIHDSGFALLAFIDADLFADLSAQNDCGGSACTESDACQCPVHLLEKLDGISAVTPSQFLSTAKYVPNSLDVPASRFLSPSEPPPKA